MSKIRDKIARIALGDIVGRGIGFLTTIYLARTLGAEAFGYITITLSFLGYQIWVSDLGLLNIGAREMAKEPVKRTFRAKEIFVAKVLLGVIVFVMGLLIIPKVDIPSRQKEIILGFSYSLIPYALLMEWYYNGKQFFGKVALSKTAHSVVYLTLALIFIKSANDLETVPLLYTAGISTSALLLGTFSLFRNPFELPFRGWNVFRDLLKSASSIGLGWFFTQSIQLLPPLVIGIVLSETDAGLYGAAVRIIFMAMIIDRIFVNLFIPNLSSQWLEDKDRARSNLRIVLNIMIGLGAVISLIIALLSPVIISLFYGPEYSDSIVLLSILSILFFSTFVNSLFLVGLVAIGKDSDFFKSTLAGGLFTFLILFIASTFQSLELLTLGVAISEFIFMIASFVWFSKYVKLKLWGPLILTSVISLGIFYLSTFLAMNVIIEALLGTILLTGLLFILGVVNSDHLKWIREKLA